MLKSHLERTRSNCILLFSLFNCDFLLCFSLLSMRTDFIFYQKLVLPLLLLGNLVLDGDKN